MNAQRCGQCLREINAMNPSVRSSASEVLECAECSQEYKFRNKMEKVGCIACGHVHKEVNMSDDRLTELLSDCPVCGYNHFTGDYDLATVFEDIVARDRHLLDELFDAIDLTPGDVVVVRDLEVEGVVSSVDGEAVEVDIDGLEVINVPISALEVAHV